MILVPSLMDNINKELISVISEELGQNSADVFMSFYSANSFEDQLSGARDILSLTIGEDRTTKLLSKIKEVK
jgi:hypothetical protein